MIIIFSQQFNKSFHILLIINFQSSKMASLNANLLRPPIRLKILSSSINPIHVVAKKKLGNYINKIYEAYSCSATIFLCTSFIIFIPHVSCRDIFFLLLSRTYTRHRQILFYKPFLDFCSRHIFEYLFDNIKADFYFRYFYRLNLIFILHLLEQVCEWICVYISMLNILCVCLIFIVDSHDND